MTFPHINSFDTDNPDKLARQLSQLEDNISRGLADASSAASPNLTVDSFLALGVASITSLGADHQLSLDTSQGNALAVLPALNAANFGRRFVLIKRTAANAITVSCTDPAVLHNGGAFPVIAAVSVRVFYCDAGGYYS